MKQLLKLSIVFSFLLVGIDAIGQYDDLYFDESDREKINEAQKQKKNKKYEYNYVNSYKEPRAGIDEEYPEYDPRVDSLHLNDRPSSSYSSYDNQYNYQNEEDSYVDNNYQYDYNDDYSEDDYYYSNTIKRFYDPAPVSNYNSYIYSNYGYNNYLGSSYYDPWGYYSPNWSIGYSSRFGWNGGWNSYSPGWNIGYSWGFPYYSSWRGGFGWNSPYNNSFCRGPGYFGNSWRYNNGYYGGFHHDHHYGNNYKNNSKPTVNTGYRQKHGTNVVTPSTTRPTTTSPSSSS